ncbi:hypothetical protein QN277_027828 [Acacia crassicarpa]|uniref:Uncharacterized protein n=1 Tax=Acacia crassicarpa TaxID=499986 RepID=A0AAE1J472_9FABA|nr:hypothetical protein QN277_027828 [Acacia crassicarpa]
MGTLGQELVSIELRDHGLENFISDRRKNLLIIFQTKILHNHWEASGVGAREHTKGEVDHLQVLGSRDGREGVRTSANVKNVGLPYPGDDEMSALPNGFVKNAPETVEEDGSLATVDGVETGVKEGCSNAEPERGACNVCEE